MHPRIVSLRPSVMNPRDQPCGFTGNADLYGIGIRIGFYLQWVSTLAATIFTPRDEGVLRILNLLIQSAVLLGMVLLTRDHKIRAIEPVITLWLQFGALSSLSGSGVNPVGKFSGIFRLLVYSAAAGYACWFWFVGLDGLLEKVPPSCTVVAFFGKVSINGPFRTFSKFASILGAIFCVFFFLWTGVYLVHRIMRLVARRNTTAHAPRTAPGRRAARVELLVLSSGVIILSIAAVEYLIAANHITGVSSISSVGQLLPLLSAILGLIQLTYGVVKNKEYSRHRCWVLLGRHLS